MTGPGRIFAFSSWSELSADDISDEVSECRNAPIFRHKCDQFAGPHPREVVITCRDSKAMSPCQNMHGAADMKQLMHCDAAWEV